MREKKMIRIIKVRGSDARDDALETKADKQKKPTTSSG